MNKKTYQAPAVKKVRLMVKNAILAVCHTSPVNDPKGTSSCKLTPRCWRAPAA